MNWSRLWQYLHNSLKTQRTYIVPTKLGFYFAILCFLILAVAFLHNNNIAYFICFMLTSLGILAMFQTNFNMHRLQIALIPMGEVFAEQPTLIKIHIRNSSSQACHHILLKIRKSSESTTVQFIGSKQELTTEIPFQFHQRGSQKPPPVIVETCFPFGLLRAWKVLKPTENIIIFPARKGTFTLPSAGSHDMGDLAGMNVRRSQGQDFIGHRPFENRDSLRRVDWKAFARNEKFNVKLFDHDDQATQLLAWSSLPNNLNLESKISQLAQWVSVCHRQRLPFILELPNWISGAEGTPKHVQECFTHLALYRPPTPLSGSR